MLVHSVLPGFVRILGWIMLLSPKSGIINQLIRLVTGGETGSRRLSGNDHRPDAGRHHSRNAGWRAFFVVVGALSLVNATVPFWKLRKIDWREPKVARFDVFGSVVWAVALSALLLGFSYLPRLTGAILIATSVVGLVLFFWWEARAADPILSVDLFLRNRVFAFSNVAALINYSA